MMKSLVFAFTCFMLLACSNGSASETAAPETTPTPVAETSTGPVKDIVHPCEAIAPATVAATFGWAASNDGMPTTMRDGRLQSCYYTSTDNVGAATITIGQSSEKTIERKGLERSFTTDLENTEDRLDYQEISGGPGDQAIYGTGKQGPAFIYRLRWRLGNTIEYSIDATFYEERDKADILPMLRELASSL